MIYIIKSLAKKSGRTVKEVEDLWDKAADIAKEDGFEGEYDYVVGILKKMLKINESVGSSAADIGIYAIDSDTTSRVIKFHGHPYFTGPSSRKVFDVDEDTFYNLHRVVKKERQWWSTWTKDKDIADYCRMNPDKHFYLRYNGIERKVHPKGIN
jgi:hypothetical protein